MSAGRLTVKKFVRLTASDAAYFEACCMERGITESDALRVALTYAGFVPLEIRNRKAAARLKLLDQLSRLESTRKARKLARLALKEARKNEV